MPFRLNDILNDQRIQRLFLEKHKCALQLWILRIEVEGSVECRIIYGRLLPYSFSNNLWSFSNNNNAKNIENHRAQVKKINLYTDGSIARSVIEMLCSGEKLRDINEKCRINFGCGKIDELFGDVKLCSEELAFIPPVYLANKDSRLSDCVVSPHGSAGGISASIVQCDKQKLFTIKGEYSLDLIAMIIEQLNQDTGLMFGDHDLSRFGDIELMVLPSIDEQEKSLKNIQWSNDKDKVLVSITPKQLHQYTKFQFNLRIENSGQIVFSLLKEARKNCNGSFECTFNTSSAFHSIADSLSLDIFGATDDNTDDFILCDRWTVHLIREVDYQIHAVDGSSELNKFDWLEKTVTPKMSERVAKVLSIKNNNRAMLSSITTRQSDPWVPINRALRENLKLIHPKKSDGAFFPRWGTSSGEGRLQFTEWFKKLAQASAGYSITIFDPYFEDAGLALILLSSHPNSDYTIFRTNHQKEGDSAADGLRILLQACAHNKNFMLQRNINIYGVSDGSLHDRYILMTDGNGLPVKGYHLSNSFQSANENYPLLITPIPTDVLYKVVEYKNGLLSDSVEKVTHLYNSKVHEAEPAQFDNCNDLFSSDVIGDILSYWFRAPSLKGLKDSELIDKLKLLNLYHDDFSTAIEPSGLKSVIDAAEFLKVDLSSWWEDIGELLSRTISMHCDIDYFSNNEFLLKSLVDILQTSFARGVVGKDANSKMSVISPIYFKQTLSDLMHSSTTPHHFSRGIKHPLLTWGEYYCIKYLWAYDPLSLLNVVDAQAKELHDEFDESDKVRLSILGQVLREITFTIEIRQTNNLQLQSLLGSKNDLFIWLAWCELDYRIASSNNFDIIGLLPKNTQCMFIGWLINRHSKNEQDENLFNKLVDVLHRLLPDKVRLPQLRDAIDSMLGHVKKLSWAEPWISRKTILPLIDSNRVKFDDASQIWHENLIGLLESTRGSSQFNVSREGELTNIAAWLWTKSSPSHQNKCLKSIEHILKKQKQVIQQPLASTSNWSNWSDSLEVSLWIWLFAEWCKHYNSIAGIDDSNKLLELYNIAKDLALVRSESEWFQSELFDNRKWVAEQTMPRQ